MKNFKKSKRFLNLDRFALKTNKTVKLYTPFLFRYFYTCFSIKKHIKLNLLKFYKKLKLFSTFIYKVYCDFIYILKNGGLELGTYTIYLLNLNFKRNRFFPQLKENYTQQTIVNNSLGIVSKHFSRKKSYLRSKAAYLLSAVYVRRLLTSLNMLYLRLEITKTPKYIGEVLSLITTNSNVLYNNPFKINSIVNEKSKSIDIKFSYVFFFNNKPYSVVKVKKKGRLKRKISKKVRLLNNILD